MASRTTRSTASRTTSKVSKASRVRAAHAKLHVKKGDRVLVITGKDRGVTGKIVQSFPATSRVLVEGVNRIKKHTKAGATARGTRTGGIITMEAPIHVSNVMLAVEVDGKTVGTRVGYRFDEDGTKIRYAKRTGEDV